MLKTGMLTLGQPEVVDVVMAKVQTQEIVPVPEAPVERSGNSALVAINALMLKRTRLPGIKRAGSLEGVATGGTAEAAA